MNFLKPLLILASCAVASHLQAAPAPVTELAPTGTVNTNLPSYQWEAVQGATHYGLWVRTQSGDPIIRNKWYRASAAGCSTSATCTITPPFPLQNGTHRWWVRAINASSSPSQKGPWTKPGIFFEVDSGQASVPDRVVVTGIDSGIPGDAAGVKLANKTPEFKWQAQINADDYLIKYDDENGSRTSSKWISASEAGCASGTGECSYTFPGKFNPGLYRWWMKARNSTGQGLWTIGIYRFSIELRIMALGDSITQGLGGDKSYRKPLIDDLTAAGCHFAMVGSQTENLTPTGFTSPHEGYSGHRVDYFVEGSIREGNPGIEAIMQAEPDIIIMHLGSNDMNNSQPITGPYKSNGLGGTITELQMLAEKIWADSDDTEIFVANVVPWFGSSSNSNISSDIEELGDEIELWVNSAADPLLHLVDVRNGFLPTYMQSDAIHPNSLGEAHISDAIQTMFDAEGYCN